MHLIRLMKLPVLDILKSIFWSIITKKRILYTVEADTPFLYLIMMWKKMTTQERKSGSQICKEAEQTDILRL